VILILFEKHLHSCCA